MEHFIDAVLEYGDWGAYITTNLILIVWLNFTRSELKDERERNNDIINKAMAKMQDTIDYFKNRGA